MHVYLWTKKIERKHVTNMSHLFCTSRPIAAFRSFCICGACKILCTFIHDFNTVTVVRLYELQDSEESAVCLRFNFASTMPWIMINKVVEIQAAGV
jgi:hypothetical protein